MIGKTLSHYEILALLGQGGMGKVYRARDQKLGREVAIKLLPGDVAQKVERKARFEREAHAIAALNHPNVVTIHSVEEADGRLFLVMELVEGATLLEKIAPGGMSMGEFFELAIPIADAVSAAHMKGITHRDLKPENIMLDRNGRVKVLDFGLAKLLDGPEEGTDATLAVAKEMTREGNILGTAAYMSPEQAEGKAVDTRSDVFSLGIIFYQMITGRQPFKGETHISTITSVLRDEPSPISSVRQGLPRHLGRIIRRCLEKDPDRRYESARGLRYDLELLREEIQSGEHEISVPAGGRPAAPSGLDSSTASGWEAEAEAGKDSPRQTLIRRSWPWAAALVAMLALLGIWQQVREAHPPKGAKPGSSALAEGAGPASDKPVIVVFPFENLGAPDDQYFAAGVTDEITTRLAAIHGLSVISRTSAQRYERAKKTMQQVAEDLGVDYVLEGSVRWERSGDPSSRVRISPQLIQADDDTYVWAETYDRKMDEIFRVQSEIAQAVVRQLGVTLLRQDAEEIASAPTRNIDAYHAYLRGWEILENRPDYTQSHWEKGIRMLKRAITLDPDFHLAYVELSKSYAGFVHFGWDENGRSLAASQAALEKAAALDPDSPDTYIARGYYDYWGLKNYKPALLAFDVALRSRPNDARIFEVIGYIRRRQGRYQEALENFQKVARLEPENAKTLYDIAETQTILGRLQEAQESFDRSIGLDPASSGSYLGKAWSSLLAGNVGQAQEDLLACPPLDDVQALFDLYRINFHARDFTEATKAATRLPDLEGSQFRIICGPLARASIHRARRENEKAHAAYVEAKTLLQSAVAESPDISNWHSGLGLALAGLGEKEAAIAEGRKALSAFPARVDDWARVWRVRDLALILAQVGENEEAIALLRDLLSGPQDTISPALLKMSPAYDSLRKDSGFDSLLAMERKS